MNEHQKYLFDLQGYSVIEEVLSEADGGFACVPGSHRADFPAPPEDRKELFSFGGPLVRNIAAPGPLLR